MDRGLLSLPCNFVSHFSVDDTHLQGTMLADARGQRGNPPPSREVALMRLLPCLFVLGAAAMAACSGGPGSSSNGSDDSVGGTAQMNDLSVLYPLAQTSSDMAGYLTATSKTAGGGLMPLALFDTVTGQKGNSHKTGPLPPGASPSLVYDDMRAVGFRLDPCFANIGPVVNESSCLNQIRVIFQSLSVSSGSVTAVDGAVHVFYSLTRAQFTAAVNEVIAARQASDPTSSDLGPLAIHPLVAKQGLNGAMAKALNAIVLKYANSANIVRLTTFLAGNLDTVWNFSGVDVSSGSTTPMDIASLPGSTTNETFFLGFGALLSGGTYMPTTTSSDNMQLLANSTNAMAASTTAQQAAYTAALKVQNPNFDSPNTIDCASCHTAQFAQVHVGEGMLGMSASGNSNVFQPNATFVSAADAAQTTPITSSTPFNVHAFSYSGQNAMINQRVINETANLVAYVNGQTLQSAASPKASGSGDGGLSVNTPQDTVDASADGGAGPSEDGGSAYDGGGASEDGGTEGDDAGGSPDGGS
jgi:hypothetical protein